MSLETDYLKIRDADFLLLRDNGDRLVLRFRIDESGEVCGSVNVFAAVGGTPQVFPSVVGETEFGVC